MHTNTRYALNAAALAVAMLCLSYASVPLYRLFCQITGFGGTTQEGKVAPGAVGGRAITIRFNADTDPHLNWTFAPGEREVRLKIGEQGLTYFVAVNNEDVPVSGHAIYNVVPHVAGAYFVKIECFCFKQQTLAARQKVHMPVSFYIDPEILNDPETRDIDTITLSYSFFKQNQ